MVNPETRTFPDWMLLLLLFLIPAHGNAQIAIKDQIPQPRQLAVGIKDTYYGFGTVGWKRWQLTAQRSFFASKLKNQYWLAEGSYSLPYKTFALFSGALHSGGTFSNSPVPYVFAGLSASGTYKAFSGEFKTYIPLQKDHPMRYAAQFQWEMWKEKLFLAGAWKPHPFFGNPQQYLSMGIVFTEKHLQVMPTYQVPDNLNGNYIQLLISFYYNFGNFYNLEQKKPLQ